MYSAKNYRHDVLFSGKIIRLMDLCYLPRTQCTLALFTEALAVKMVATIYCQNLSMTQTYNVND